LCRLWEASIRCQGWSSPANNDNDYNIDVVNESDKKNDDGKDNNNENTDENANDNKNRNAKDKPNNNDDNNNVSFKFEDHAHACRGGMKVRSTMRPNIAGCATR
jgi:hypothetical protein